MIRKCIPDVPALPTTSTTPSVTKSDSKLPSTNCLSIPYAADAEIVEKLVARRSDCCVKAQLSVTRSESAFTGVYGQYLCLVISHIANIFTGGSIL